MISFISLDKTPKIRGNNGTDNFINYFRDIPTELILKNFCHGMNFPRHIRDERNPHSAAIITTIQCQKLNCYIFLAHYSQNFLKEI